MNPDRLDSSTDEDLAALRLNLLSGTCSVPAPPQCWRRLNIDDPIWRRRNRLEAGVRAALLADVDDLGDAGAASYRTSLARAARRLLPAAAAGEAPISDLERLLSDRVCFYGQWVKLLNDVLERGWELQEVAAARGAQAEAELRAFRRAW